MTYAPHRLVGVPGGLRAEAFSTAPLETLAAAPAPQVVFDYTDIGGLPHFNQDLYVEPLPEAVKRFRRQIDQADGIVISSPEYNDAIPGVHKTALDWASRRHNGSPLRDKPVLIITSSQASTGGVRAHRQIRETLVSALARPGSTPEIVVAEVGSKIVDGRFSDGSTIAFARQGLAVLFDEVASTKDRSARPLGLRRE